MAAEREGFEPPDLLQSSVFKTGAFDRSAISPIESRYLQLPTLVKDLSWDTVLMGSVISTLSHKPDSNQRPSDYKSEALPTELLWLILSGYEDSNLGPSGPKPDALPDCATSRTFVIQ